MSLPPTAAPSSGKQSQDRGVSTECLGSPRIDTTCERTGSTPTPTAERARDMLRAAPQGIAAAVRVVQEELANYSTYNDTRAKPLALLRELFPSQVLSPTTWIDLEMDKWLLSVFGEREESGLRRCSKIPEFVALYKRCAQLPTDPAEIQLRQDASRELESGSAAAKAILSIFSNSGLSKFMQFSRAPGFSEQYDWYRENSGFARQMIQVAREMPQPESLLLREVRSSILGFAESELGQHYQHGTSFAFKGLEPSNKVSFFAHAFKFWPFGTDPIVGPLGWAAAAAATVTGLVQASSGAAVSEAINALSLGGIFGGATWLYGNSRNWSNRELVIKPLSKLAQRDFSAVLGAATIIGELQCLLEADSHIKQPPCVHADQQLAASIYFCEGNGQPSAPSVAAYHGYYPESAELIRSQERCRLNDIFVRGDAFTALLGPNSGGKTYTGRALALNVLRHHLGTKALCTSGVCAPFSKIVWYSPKESTSESNEGSLGEELAPLAPLLHGGINQRTLLLCDDLGARGAEEGAIAGKALEVLDVVFAANASVVLVTHNASLISSLRGGVIPLRPYHPELVQLEDGVRFLSCRLLEGFPPAHVKPREYVEAVAQRLGLGSEQLRELKAAILREQAAQGGANGPAFDQEAIGG